MATTAESKATTPQPAPRRSRWKRVLAVVILVPLILAGVGYWLKFGPLVTSQPYKIALDTAVASPQLVAKLGEPIRRAWSGWLPAGQVNNDSDRGEARLLFRVEGPKGAADLSAAARRMEGQWFFNQLEATLEDSQRLNLTAEANKGLKNDTPTFDPTKQNGDPPKVQNATPDQDIKIDLDLPGQTGGDTKK